MADDQQYYEGMRARLEEVTGLWFAVPFKTWTSKKWADYMSMARDDEEDRLASRLPPCPALTVGKISPADLFRASLFMTRSAFCISPHLAKKYDELDAVIEEEDRRIQREAWEAEQAAAGSTDAKTKRRTAPANAAQTAKALCPCDPLPDIPKRNVAYESDEKAYEAVRKDPGSVEEGGDQATSCEDPGGWHWTNTNSSAGIVDKKKEKNKRNRQKNKKKKKNLPGKRLDDFLHRAATTDLSPSARRRNNGSFKKWQNRNLDFCRTELAILIETNSLYSDLAQYFLTVLEFEQSQRS
ncbi:hypothetical protein CF319_g7437 [Tilletia indica]|nr:hypothetical protein CF319_g7437 [Tilletia indica]